MRKQAKKVAPSSKIKNSQIKSVLGSLQVVGLTRIPIQLAMRMAQARVHIESIEAAVEKARGDIIRRLSDGGDSIDLNHPKWGEWVEAFEQLMDVETEIPFRFTIYQREKGDDIEFAWTESFKAGIVKELEPNVLYGLLPVMDVVTAGEVDPSE